MSKLELNFIATLFDSCERSYSQKKTILTFDPKVKVTQKSNPLVPGLCPTIP